MATTATSSGRARRRVATTTTHGDREGEKEEEEGEIRWNGRNDSGTVKGDLMVWNYRGSTVVEVFDQSIRPSACLFRLS